MLFLEGITAWTASRNRSSHLYIAIDVNAFHQATLSPAVDALSMHASNQSPTHGEAQRWQKEGSTDPPKPVYRPTWLTTKHHSSWSKAKALPKTKFEKPRWTFSCEWPNCLASQVDIPKPNVLLCQQQWGTSFNSLTWRLPHASSPKVTCHVFK